MNNKRFASLLLAALMLLYLAFPALAAEDDYKDIPDGAWYSEAVAYCSGQNLMNGMEEGLFQPQSQVSRAMAVTVLFRMAGSPKPLDPSAGFSDVPEGAWFAPAIAWGVETELVRGYENGGFLPNQSISRQELATLFWRFAGSPEAKGDTEPFADDGEISSFAVEAVYWSREEGLINGMGEGRFAPRGQATRAQLAQLLMKFDTYMRKGLRIEMDVLCAPNGIAAHSDGSLMVTDTYGHKIWQLRDGEAAVYAGADTVKDRNGDPLGGYNDAALSDGWFSDPWAIAPYRDGWAVSDAGNNALRYLDKEGVQRINVSIPSKDGSLAYPTGLAADDSGNLYVSDTHHGAIYRISGNGLVTKVADKLDDPMGLCWQEGVLYVAETGSNRILTIRNGKADVLAGTGEMGAADGPALEASFAAPQGIAVGPDGSVYISDTVNSALRVLRTDGMVETLLEQSEGGMDIYPVSPTGLLILDGRLYVCDNYARRVFSLPLR